MKASNEITTYILHRKSFPRVIRDNLSLDHDLLPLRLDTSKGKELSLEEERQLIGVQLYIRVVFLSPLNLHCKEKEEIQTR